MKHLLALLFLMSTLAFADKQIFTYKPMVVELPGVLDLQTFPGPPNFESIKGGDDLERHFYLKLDKPIEVKPSGKHPEIDNPEHEQNVKIIQLSIRSDDESLWSKIRKIGEGGRIKAKGTLFHRFTGHHHSRILLDVHSLERLH